MKVCTKCAQPLTPEVIAKGGKDPKTGEGRTRNVCKSCWNSYVRAHKARNREKDRAQQRAWKLANADSFRCSHLRSLYGLSLAEYQRLETEQEGKCACCRQPEIGTYRSNGVIKQKRLAVDHCHDTGRIRGLLCANCNTALGLIQEDPARARSLADYLEFNNDIPLRWAVSADRREEH